MVTRVELERVVQAYWAMRTSDSEFLRRRFEQLLYGKVLDSGPKGE